MLLRLAAKSLLSRKGSVLLTLLSMILSISLLISVEHIRQEAKNSFKRTVSGIDLIVGAPTGDLTLLLGAIFRVGQLPGSLQWSTYQMVSQHKHVAWSIPFALGDSHHGYTVLGTTSEYFRHYKYGNKQALSFAKGQAFDAPFEAVIGAQVATQLNYQLGDTIELAHGTGNVSFTRHSAHPFVVSGILKPSGTPIDRTVHVDLHSLEAVHASPEQSRSPFSRPQTASAASSSDDAHQQHEHEQHEPETISGFLLGLTSPIATLQIQRQLNQYKADPMQAILPGVALNQLWQILATLENILLVVSGLILIASLIGLATMLLATMRERNRELAVLRALGAGPLTVFLLLQAEALLLVLVSMTLALVLTSMVLIASQAWLSSHYGIYLSTNVVSPSLMPLLIIVIIATMVVALFPSISAYRQALHSNLRS